VALHPAPRTGLIIVSQLEPDLPEVLADPDQVTQVLLNLVKNADEALGSEGGTIRLSAFRDGDAVVLAVADDGPGIAPADRERIFEPYFSTKETGTGLGLPIARRIAEEHGGTLAARSDPGRGAIFELRLPAL
jgi:signal transduction histidine kinase